MEEPAAGLDIRNASVGPDLQIVLESREGVPEELVYWAQEGEAIFWIALYEPISNSLPVQTDWFFVLDLDGKDGPAVVSGGDHRELLPTL